MKPKKAPASTARPSSPTALLEERGLPIVSVLDRIAKSADPPRVKLEGAMEIVFGAFGESDLDFSGLFLAGWMRAREDKHFRLTLAWQREQIRLALQDILTEGVAAGAFRADLDPGAVAAVILGTAEGCLLQSATQGGAVPPGQLLRTLLRLLVTSA
ncbi:MAG TPA: TetR family transcriptional regulator C-terminal domain-containing protein [Methylomirabilota bacterium]|nr:TetR family transcriptional regulator C-terminal domain-containing protein [Methylomirabilota bacterium]